MDDLQFIRDAGETRRFHTWPVLRTQNIAEHSWHVTMLGWLLYGGDEPGVTMPFIMALMTHDMAECKVGDLPAPAKRAMGDMFNAPGNTIGFREAWGLMEQEILSKFSMDWEKFLTDEEKRRLKLCDSMEGALYCVRERAMGNKLIAPAYMNFIHYVTDLMNEPPDVPLEPCEPTITEREWQVREFIQNEWSKASVGG